MVVPCHISPHVILVFEGFSLSSYHLKLVLVDGQAERAKTISATQGQTKINLPPASKLEPTFSVLP